MASPSPLLLLLLLLLAIAATVNAQTAPAPAPSPLNLTDTLVQGGQYTFLLRLLSSTQVGSQIVNQANSSTQGLTLLAPTDNAFQNLKSGILNNLSQDKQVALVLYHVLPQFYTLQDFQTISNPVRTQASGNGGGIYTLNFTTSGNQVNVSTGLVETQINNALRSTRPLAVYQLDKVLLPLDLFGAKPPSTSPPASPKSPGSNRSPPTAAASPAEGNPGESPNNGGGRGLSSRWSLAVAFGFLLASVLV